MRILFFILAFIFNFYFIALNVLGKHGVLRCFAGFEIFWFLLALFFFLTGFFWNQHFWRRLYRKMQEKSEKGTKIAISILFTLCVFFVCMILFAVHYIVHNGKSDSQNYNESGETKIMIVLGGGMQGDGSLPPAVVNRLETAAERILMEKYPDFLLVMAGGKLPLAPCDEATVMKDNFNLLLPESGFGTDVITEAESQDTIQNLQNSAKLAADELGISLDQVLNREVIIVTSDFHLARAKLLASRLGFKKVTGLSSTTPAFYALNNYSREVFAYMKLGLRMLFTGKPSTL